MIGRIHSVESFSTVDGPGVRYVVFMQGCNLRCQFCHNPDTWSRQAGIEITEEELIAKILKAKVYMQNGKGGVTFSGGEPLLQAKFLLPVCKVLKEQDIHITVDTAGNFDTTDPDINALIPYVDLFLMDLKHIDKKEHEALIGVSNDKILDFVTYLSNVKKKPMWIRIVYIPCITDKKDALTRYQQKIATLKSVEKVEILPYHEMGKYKWAEMGLKYELEDARVPTKEETEKIKNIFSQCENKTK